LALIISLASGATALAYTDLSTYKIDTGEFKSESEAQSAVSRLQNDTGWTAAYESLNRTLPLYQLVSGGFRGEDSVKEAVKRLQEDTGIQSFYESTGNTHSIYQLVTGGFKGEDKVVQALNNFRNSTGIAASYEPTGSFEQLYSIVTGGFQGEDRVKQALHTFQAGTGINATYESTGKYVTGRQIVSGGFQGEDSVKQALETFQKSTGLRAAYEPTGSFRSAYQILSGGYKGEDRVKQALSEFQKSTGLSGTYEPTGNSEQLYQIISGGFQGEDRVRNAFQEFKNATGINGEIVPVGEKKNFYSVFTGGFSGEAKVKELVQQIKSELNVEAAYEPIPNSTAFRIVFAKIEQDSLPKVENFMRTRNWWYSTPKLVSTEYTHYRIHSESVNLSKRDQGLNFFKSKGWYASSQATEKIYTYNIKSGSLSKADADKGLNFFQSKGWWATAQTTGEKIYSYRIKSVPLIQSDLQKGLKFFSDRGWWATSQSTDEKIYSYIIKTGSLNKSDRDKGLAFFAGKGWWATSQLAEKLYSFRIKTDSIQQESLDKALEFAKQNNWWVTYNTVSKIESFRIKTGDLVKEDADKALNFFEKQGWWATIQPSGNSNQLYQIVVPDFEGYDKAQAAAQRIQSLYGWNTNLVKTKNGPQLMYTDYGMTLPAMLDKQMQGSPQTDKYRNEPRFIHADYVDLAKKVVTADRVNVRTGPSTTSSVTQQVNAGTSVMVIAKTGDWVEVRLTWQNATASDVGYYLNPDNFSINNKDYFQFLKLSQTANINAREVNEKILKGKGILDGKGQSFVDAAQKYNINELYLISHSLLETGNGTSSLATGTVYNGRTVYNMYGYGAYDSCPLTCGAKAAYDNGWFTPEAAIVGGAQFISSRYIYNSTFQQDTLYKMRWNPVQPWHQYATDIGWAYKQVNSIYNLYQLLDNYTLYYDVPNYQYR
jgi:mannosyl-glycoprotein endo-beta-N-acetylglucosaminidase